MSRYVPFLQSLSRKESSTCFTPFLCWDLALVVSTLSSLKRSRKVTTASSRPPSWLLTQNSSVRARTAERTRVAFVINSVQSWQTLEFPIQLILYLPSLQTSVSRSSCIYSRLPKFPNRRFPAATANSVERVEGGGDQRQRVHLPLSPATVLQYVPTSPGIVCRPTHKISHLSLTALGIIEAKKHDFSIIF